MPISLEKHLEIRVFVQERLDSLAHYGSLTTFGQVMVNSLFLVDV